MQEFVGAAQERVLEGVREAQTTMVRFVRTWSETVARMTPQVRVPLAAAATRPADVVDNSFEFAERLLATQRRFARELFGATQPALRLVEDFEADSVEPQRARARP